MDEQIQWINELAELSLNSAHDRERIGTRVTVILEGIQGGLVYALVSSRCSNRAKLFRLWETICKSSIEKQTSDKGKIMQFQINTDHNIKGQEALPKWVISTVKGTLGRLSDYITRLDVHLSDENSDKKAGKDTCVVW